MEEEYPGSRSYYGQEIAPGIVPDLKKTLKDWLEFAKDVQPGCAAGAEWLDMLRERTQQLIDA